MNRSKALWIELALWLALFAVLFSRGPALFALPVVLALIGLRFAAAVIGGAFRSVFRGK